ncbi:MAG: acyl-CoA thioesterase [Cytophagaceae bacterium]|nr:MAG: acyl-CoA thioesterase [Cytophagaceae bacterium]
MRTLVARTEVPVRFNEVDSLGIAWHGHYVRYFEDGREAFGAAHGLGYLDVYRAGLVTPIVQLTCDYKRPLAYGDSVRIETTFVDSPAARIHFTYRLYHAGSGELVAEGETTQVFLALDSRALLLNVPPFFEDWKQRRLPALTPA